MVLLPLESGQDLYRQCHWCRASVSASPQGQ